MSKKECAVQFLQLVIAGKIREAYDRYTHLSMIHHNVYFPGDRESLLVGMEESETRFPKKQFETVHVLEDGNMVATHSRLKLHNDMPEMTVVHLFRFDGDLIVEMWDVGQQIPEDSPNHYGAF